MSWWLKNNIRMIQNNFRDIDANMNIDKYIEWVKSFHVNVIQIGCGGITSFHHTKLDVQWQNPYLKGDFLGEIIEKAHKNDIKVIVRFDFSKTHESFLDSRPNWFIRNKDGDPIRYHDTVATCVNGEYQQEICIEIIEEVIRKYPVDGIFFNMFGYIAYDYSGNYFGICRCINCKNSFKNMYGAELPNQENDEKYKEFKTRTVDGILSKIRRATKAVNPNIAISTYKAHAVDIVRNESNSAVDRPLPFWIYNSTDNVSRLEGSYDDKISSNVAINAVDLPYRFMGVSDYLNQIRLYGNMAAGGSLDWCIIGSFDDYTDYDNFDGVRKIYAFHKKYEEYYGRFDPKTKVLLVCDNGEHTSIPEYRGIFRMLKESHIQFTVMDKDVLKDRCGEFDDYDFVLLPGIKNLEPEVCAALEKTTASIIGTKYPLASNSKLLQSLFGVKLIRHITDVRGTYVKLHNRKWVFVDQAYYEMELQKNTEGMLPKIEKARFGPPERCYGHEETNISMAAVKNRNVYLPWAIGSLYYGLGYAEFINIFFDLMEKVRPVPRCISTNAPEMVEMFFSKLDDSTYMLQMINMTGYNGMTFFKPLAVRFNVTFNDVVPVKIAEMHENGLRPTEYGNKLEVELDGLYKAYLVYCKV